MSSPIKSWSKLKMVGFGEKIVYTLKCLELWRFEFENNSKWKNCNLNKTSTALKYECFT